MLLVLVVGVVVDGVGVGEVIDMVGGVCVLVALMMLVMVVVLR